MANKSNTTFVLVPGSFATTIFYDKVTPLLSEAGCKFKLVELLSPNDGSRMPPATMQEDAAHIRANVQELLDADQNVVLVLHSYSGFPGSEALKGLGQADRGAHSTAVIKIVYITSFLPVEGESSQDIMAEYQPEEFRKGNPGGYLPFAREMAPMVFNDFPEPEEIERYADSMLSQGSDAFRGKVSYAAWKHIPSTYISAGQDMIVPTTVQTEMLDRAAKENGKVTRVFLEDAGHSPNVSRPGRVVEELLKAVET